MPTCTTLCGCDTGGWGGLPSTYLCVCGVGGITNSVTFITLCFTQANVMKVNTPCQPQSLYKVVNILKAIYDLTCVYAGRTDCFSPSPMCSAFSLFWLSEVWPPRYTGHLVWHGLLARLDVYSTKLALNCSHSCHKLRLLWLDKANWIVEPCTVITARDTSLCGCDTRGWGGLLSAHLCVCLV